MAYMNPQEATYALAALGLAGFTAELHELRAGAYITVWDPHYISTGAGRRAYGHTVVGLNTYADVRRFLSARS